jgi:hypothetical protein
MAVSSTSGLSFGGDAVQHGIPQSKGKVKNDRRMARKRRFFMKSWDSRNLKQPVSLTDRLVNVC